MAFRSGLKQSSNSHIEKKKVEQIGTSFSTNDSCSSSRFSFQSGFNGNPSPSLRHIEPCFETASDKYRSPTYQDLLSQKSIQSFTEIMTSIHPETEEICHKISEQVDESFSTDSDSDEHCIWDNSEAEQFGIDCKDFLNADRNALTFYQLYSIRSQLYQKNRVLRSTAIEEVNTISRFYEKPIKFSELMNQQTYLDNTCPLFQQLPSLNNSNQNTNNINLSEKQKNEESIKPSFVNINCGNRNKQVEVKKIDISLIIQEKQTQNKRNELKHLFKTQPSIEDETPKKMLVTSVTSPKRDVPVKKLDLTDILGSFKQVKTMPEIDISTDIETTPVQSQTFTNIPSFAQQKMTQKLSQLLSTPQKKNVGVMGAFETKRQQENTSVERLKYKSAQKAALPLITNRIIVLNRQQVQQRSTPKSQQSPSSVLRNYNKITSFTTSYAC